MISIRGEGGFAVNVYMGMYINLRLDRSHGTLQLNLSGSRNYGSYFDLITMYL